MIRPKVFARSADGATVSTIRTSVDESVRAVLQSPLEDDVAGLDPLVEESRSRPSSALSRRAGLVSTLSAAGYALAALAMVLGFDVRLADINWSWAALFIVAYAAVSRVEFEIGTGAVVPTEIVLVPMLFVLPPAAVPLAVGAAYLLGASVDVVMGQLRPQRLPVVLSTCWHAIGPALVLAAAGLTRPSWHDLPIYAAALAAQFAFDAASSIARESVGFGVSPARVIGFLQPVFLVDLLLAPVGLLAAFAIAPNPLALLALLPLAGLLWVFARDRRARIDQALALTVAYRGASDEARHDALTGVLNRLGWEETIAEAEEHLPASGERASVIMLDVDGLKQANDVHGHDFGDAVIRSVAHVLSRSVREHDVVARIGGDEFAILMPGCGEQDCQMTMRRLTETLGRQRVASLPISASMGGATCSSVGNLRHTVRRADARMYQLKRPSRDAVASPVVDRRVAR